MATNVRQRMIERTALLLARKGLQGASFSEILQASGAPRGSLYHHFPGGKDELVLAAVAFVSNHALEQTALSEGRPASEVAEAFIGLWRAVLERSQFTTGCAIVAVTVAADTPKLLDTAGAVFRSWRVRLGDLMAAGGIAPDKAPAIAATLIAACEGAVILSRAERSMEPFDLVAAQQLAMVRGAMGAASK